MSLRNTVHYHYGKFPPSAELLGYQNLIPALLKASEKLARYDQILKSMHNSELMLAPLRDREAVISSRIEGTVSTIDDVLAYRADTEGDESGNTDLPNDVQEVSLYAETLKLAQQIINHAPLSPDLLKQLHARLLSHGRGANKLPGAFKTEPNYVSGGSTIAFIPINPEELQNGVRSLFDFINAENIFDPLTKTALAHVEFEALHPFRDGNGRIGRMLITLMLWHFGKISAPSFYISDYFEQNRDTYIMLMRAVSENNNWQAWTDFFLRAIETQADRNLRTAEQIQTLYMDYKERFRLILRSEYSIKALDFLFIRPIFNNSIFTDEQKSGIPYQTAARISKLLSENNILKTLREGVGRRPARYSFEPLMQILRT